MLLVLQCQEVYKIGSHYVYMFKIKEQGQACYVAEAVLITTYAF